VEKESPDGCAGASMPGWSVGVTGSDGDIFSLGETP
jgi:hypothetical protein